MKPDIFRFRVFSGACSLQNEVGDPPLFFAFLANVHHYLPVWQVLKNSVRGNILGANVLEGAYLLWGPFKTGFTVC